MITHILSYNCEIWGAYLNKIFKRGKAPQLKEPTYTPASRGRM